MANSVDPDQLASSEANWSGSTVCNGRVYPGSAGQGLTFTTLLATGNSAVDKSVIFSHFSQKIGLDISCKLSICMKYQNLFSGNNKKKIL